MSLERKPYEISIWEDKLIYVGTDGNEYDNITQMSVPVAYQYYTEKRIATIGSNTMTSPARAINPYFKYNINGVTTLTFDMYYQYMDDEQGQIVRNPLIDLVIDERKIKLKYLIDGETDPWHDFIVKKDDEKGRDYKYSYTCTGLAANELGKTGFNIELDTELSNNMGTVQELGAAVLEGSDWQLAENGQQVIQQTSDEALYSIILGANITNAKKLDGTSFGATIAAGKRIYAYYTPYTNKEEDYFQFIYVDGDTGAAIPDLYEDGVTIYCNNTRTYDLYCSDVRWDNDQPSFESSKNISTYRGRRYVRKQQTTYDPVLEKTVGKYTGEEDGETKVFHGYTTTEYIDSTTVTNYIYNSTNFQGTSYWTAYNNASIDTMIYPQVGQTTDWATNDDYSSYLKVNLGTNTGANLPRVLNDGIIQNYSRINNFEKGQKYRFKIWVGTLSGQTVTPLNSIPFRVVVKKYVTVDSDNENDQIYFTFNGPGVDADNGYRVIDATCIQSATWRDLQSNVGIFLYVRANGNYETNYYIKDIQFYRYIEDQNHNPLDINQVPEVRVNTIYHFYDPSVNAGFTSPEDYIYANSDKSLYTPMYGSGEEEFEKVRSITAKESNRFNLLQELSETFECWIKFVVSHETGENPGEIAGRIKVEDYIYYNPVNIAGPYIRNTYYIYDQNSKQYILSSDDYDSRKQYYSAVQRKRQDKKVVFYGEILQDNYVGFKYGINLKDNNRTLDSEQIVTKIIVKNNNCEYANNGFCSIARAEDNPIKENFALNFDYYTSQGLINTSTLNNDLYLQVNGSIGLYPRLSKLNKTRNDLIEEQALLGNSIDNLTAQYQTYQLEYNESARELSRLSDPTSGTLVKYTGYTYDDFGNQCKRLGTGGVAGANIKAYSNEVYYIKNAITGINPTPSIFCIKNTDTAPVSGETYYTLNGNKFVTFGGTKFSSSTTYYKRVSAQYSSGTFFQTSSNTTSLTFTEMGSSSAVYIYNAARRIQNLCDTDFINDTAALSYIQKIRTLTKVCNASEVEAQTFKTDLDNATEEYESIKAQLKDIAQATDEVEKDFYTKYARYIQEGSWIDDNYMDDDLYYLDSLSVLYQSAYPKITYNFSVLELSQLEGYEAYVFNVGHKTFVEDTEFFGYIIKDGLRTPARETVVVTEALVALDSPDKNSLKVQNYKSHFEDLFQRITAATQTLEYHSGEYAKAAGAITSTGEISQSVMQKSLATSAYVIQNSRDQSVTWDETGLQAIKLNDPAQVTRLSSGGLLVSTDGGQTWGVAITGYGINTNYLTAGQIDADQINILSGAYPTFRWDAHGLRAYAYSTNGGGDNEVLSSYDPTRFVNYDRFGIYGINSINDPNFTSVSDVENNASFALTWNGLFMRAQHRDGYVRISPTDDITLVSTASGSPVTRGKFGLLSDSNAQDEIYGLALYDASGAATVETKSTGTLWLKSQMDIGTDNTNQIYLGVGTEETQEHGYKVFKVYGNRNVTPTGEDEENTDRFIVYEDGTLKARGVEIEGAVNATSGTIGGLSVDALPEVVGARIVAENGDTFKIYSDNTASPASLVFDYKTGLDEDNIGNDSIKWYYGTTPNDMSEVPAAWVDQNHKLTITYSNISSTFSSSLMYIKLVITPISGSALIDQMPLKQVSDGQDGEGYNFVIESSLGNIINPASVSDIQTTLTAYVYKGTEDITLTRCNNFVWKAKEDEGNWTIIGTSRSIEYNITGWQSSQVYFEVEVSS